MSGPHFALCVDKSYVEPGAVVVASTAAHYAGDGPLTVWLLHDGMSEAQQQLYKAACSNRVTLNMIQTPSDITALPSMSDYISSATFGRLALADLLPPKVERVIYLDADLLVVGDISPLWRHDLGGATLAAVREPSDPFFWSRNGLEHVYVVGLDPWTPYFNAGVLVMDLPRFRDQQMRQRCLDYVAENRPARMDQDALNALLHNQIAELPTVFNVEDYFFKSTSRRKRYASLLRQARVLHFVGPNKPWNHKVWRASDWADVHASLRDAGV